MGHPAKHGWYETLLADPEIEAIYIPLPNTMHAEWTIGPGEAGKHVLCEKPLTPPGGGQGRLGRGRPGGALLEAFMYRHHPQSKRLRALVRRGRSASCG